MNSDQVLLTPISQRSSLQLPECPPPPRSQKPSSSREHAGFPTLPFLFNDNNVARKSEVIMLKPRLADKCSSFAGTKTDENQGASHSTEKTMSIVWNAKGVKMKEHVATGCLPSPLIPFSKAA